MRSLDLDTEEPGPRQAMGCSATPSAEDVVLPKRVDNRFSSEWRTDMNIFLTGATGYVGSAIAAALQHRGRTRAGLARLGSAVRALTQRGIPRVAGGLAGGRGGGPGGTRCEGTP